VVIQFLEPPDAHSLADLHATIRDVPPERIDAAVSSLTAAGVIQAAPDGVLVAGDVLARLDALGLICI